MSHVPRAECHFGPLCSHDRQAGARLHSQVLPPWSNGTVWCWSHCRAGRLHPRNTQVVLRIWIRYRSDGGGAYFTDWAGGESWPGKVPVEVRQPAGHRGDPELRG